MNNPLKNLSLEELWQLFPIELVKHNDDWNNWFNDEKENLINIINEDVLINHIGSTSLEDIYAKNIVDIIVETNNDIYEIQYKLETNGYITMSNEGNRISMNKGYTINGFAEKVFHIHIRQKGDNDELYFRDYLRENKDIAKEYETLKISLSKAYKHNRDAYTDSKTDFIKHYSNQAKTKYENRY